MKSYLVRVTKYGEGGRIPEDFACNKGYCISEDGSLQCSCLKELFPMTGVVICRGNDSVPSRDEI